MLASNIDSFCCDFSSTEQNVLKDSLVQRVKLFMKLVQMARCVLVEVIARLMVLAATVVML